MPCASRPAAARLNLGVRPLIRSLDTWKNCKPKQLRKPFLSLMCRLRRSWIASGRPRNGASRPGASLQGLSWRVLPLAQLQRTSRASASLSAVSGAGLAVLLSDGLSALGVVGGARPNNAFKPKLHRYASHMAEKACHVSGYALQFGLT